MEILLIGVVLGGLASWAITHWYHVLGRRDQQAMLDKLPEELVKALRGDRRSTLTVRELNDLLRDRVINRVSNNPLPYKACPKCGSENIYESRDFIVDCEMGDAGELVYSATPYKTVECADCEWRDDEIKRTIDHIKG